MIKDFNDFWEEVTYYDIPYCQEEPFKYGFFYEYVSSTLLNGIINYVDIICANVLCRYTDIGKENELQKQIEEFNKSDGEYNTELGQFSDDVIILAYEENTKAYWYFWFDYDVSDCCVGRFKTDLSKQEVIDLYNKELDRLITSNDDFQRAYYPLNVKNIQEWISF